MSAAPAEPVAWRYLVHGIWSVTNIKAAADFWQSEGCVVEPLYTAPAQSDAEPDPNFPDPNFDPVEAAQVDARSIEEANAQFDAERGHDDNFERHLNARISKLECEVAEPTPDASAGLIEALERISKSNVYDMNTLHPDGCARVAAEALKAFRDADRSEPPPDVSAGLIEAADLAENYSDKYYNGDDLAVAVVLRDLAKQLRARAADRSRK